MSLPNGSDTILNASAANGSCSSALRSSTSSPRMFVPSAGGMSSGLGMKSTTASSIGWTPLFLNAEPQSTGTKLNASVPVRIARLISSSESSSSERYFSISTSSSVAMMSSSFARHSFACASYSAGMSTMS